MSDDNQFDSWFKDHGTPRNPLDEISLSASHAVKTLKELHRETSDARTEAKEAYDHFSTWHLGPMGTQLANIAATLRNIMWLLAGVLLSLIALVFR